MVREVAVFTASIFINTCVTAGFGERDNPSVEGVAFGFAIVLETIFVRIGVLLSKKMLA